jgi:hypothetical protein
MERLETSVRVLLAVSASLKPVPWRVVDGLSSVYRWESDFDFGLEGVVVVVEAACLVVVVRFGRVEDADLVGGAFGIMENFTQRWSIMMSLGNCSQEEE